MKNKFVKALFVTSLLTFLSCGDDYLDPRQDTSILTDADLQEAAEHNPEIIFGTLNGIYTLMMSPGAAGTTQHYDFGQKANDVWLDMLVGDMALSANSYNWYARFTQFQVTQDFSQQENLLVWKYYYAVIKSANSVINALGGNDAEPTTAEARHMLGQAKALRAHSYFYLVNLFTREYDPAKEVLPIYTELGTPPQAKSTMGDVYTLIIDDLTQAITLLDGFQRSFKHEINKEVAQGLLAYTYAAMGDYPNAKITSNLVIDSGLYPLTTAAQTVGTAAPAGFNEVATASWMWGYNMEENLGVNLISWWGQIDYYTYSYAYAGDRKSIDLGLYDQIPSNDIRKGQFLSNLAYMPTNKFFHPARVGGQQRYISTDYIYMRVDEMYLLNAEACAKSGDEDGAKTRLKQLLSLRFTGGASQANTFVDALSGQALIDEIYKQTRIELWGEGKAYFAMKRNQATITRGSNHLFHAGVVIPYNDDRMFFKIPQNEILNNPHISGQN